MDDINVFKPAIRLKLIRKGNELFNQGKYREAEKIFLTVKYVDGLIRLGDYYYFEKKDAIHALKLYLRSGYKKKINEVLESIATIIKIWLKETK